MRWGLGQLSPNFLLCYQVLYLCSWWGYTNCTRVHVHTEVHVFDAFAISGYLLTFTCVPGAISVTAVGMKALSALEGLYIFIFLIIFLFDCATWHVGF